MRNSVPWRWGSWDTTRTVINIPYSMHIANTTAQSAVSCRSRITNVVRLQAREAYTRHLDLTQRIQYVHTVPVGKTVVYGTSPTGPLPSDSSNSVCGCLVHLAGEHFSITPLHAVEKRKKGPGA